jgi:predicted ATPase/DNA-binding CsgD family transcriptional regulator
VGDDAAGTAGVVRRGFRPALTSFVGRAAAVADVADLLARHRVVTVTGPGGVGKTRLAAEVSRQVAGRFADGVVLAELAAVQEPGLVPAAVTAALGIPLAGRGGADALAAVLARQQLLLVLDNCEQVIAAVAELCASLLAVADDVRILATSREPVGVAGEARYRLPPLGVPGPDGRDWPDGRSEAVELFADRARLLDPHFSLDGESGVLAAQLVRRLDGMPLAIELAAARVEALGLAQLLDRMNDMFPLLVGGDRLAPARQRSLAATVDWSYRLLGENEQLIFRRIALFPAPFTLAAAEAVGGADAGPVVLHLVDCSLLAPPQSGPDGRARYLMLETLRAFGTDRLAAAGDEPAAAAALAGYAVAVAEQAAAGLQTSAGELDAARWLDAEDATVHQALAWALEHEPGTALRLAVALAPWWLLRGRAVSGYAQLHAAANSAAPGSEAWRAAQFWLGQAASGPGDALGHYTALRDAAGGQPPSRALADGLNGRSNSLLNLGRIPAAADEARQALAVAAQLGYPAGQARALMNLGLAALYAGNLAEALSWARQAQQVDPAALPGRLARQCNTVAVLAMIQTGEAAAARDTCADGLARARQAGDLQDQALWLEMLATLEQQAGRMPEAWAALAEALRIATRISAPLRLADCLDNCGRLCTADHRWAEAVTLWAARAAWLRDTGMSELPGFAQRRAEPLGAASLALGPAATAAAQQRGAAMTLATAAEFALMLGTLASEAAPAEPGVARLSPREQELITLVARGRTDAQIAEQLYISIRTVRSHLDRIRDKSGCRRRADLTRLALEAGLV